MQVILRQTVENLGKPGDIVKVKPGYAQNFLIPQQMALPVTEGNIRRIESEKHRLALREAKLKAQAEEVVAQFGKTKLSFEKKAGVEGVLYGSVTTNEIAEALESKGLEDVDKRNLILPEPIKRIGDFEVILRLHPEVEMPIAIHVHSEDGMAEKAIAEAQVQQAASEGSIAVDEAKDLTGQEALDKAEKVEDLEPPAAPQEAEEEGDAEEAEEGEDEEKE